MKKTTKPLTKIPADHSPVAMTPAELAVMVRRSTVTLERWRRLRRGPPHFYVGNRALYLIADVEAWLAAQVKQSGRDNDGTVARKPRKRPAGSEC